MKPIQKGDTGAAVEDIQRRLRVLGYDLGASGIDGVFHDDTRTAVETFQRASGIQPTGVVGPRTWSALVDSTFELGDRMLYLRMPHFHGADVAALQNALNSLGFVTGGADGIFGSYTERAVAEFQQNCHLNPDGIAGADTFRALFALRHIWGDKEGSAHSSARGAPRPSFLTLLTCHFVFEAQVGAHVHDNMPEENGNNVLCRLAQVANSIELAARNDMIQSKDRRSASIPATTVHVVLSIGNEEDALAGATGDSGTGNANRAGATDYFCQFCNEYFADFLTELPAEIQITIPAGLLKSSLKPNLPIGLQHLASSLLDALCAAVGKLDVVN